MTIPDFLVGVTEPQKRTLKQVQLRILGQLQMKKKIERSEKEWREHLTPEQFRVCRQKGTESPFTGQYTDCKKLGIYLCVCCGNPLFDSNTKYDSGSGWPSFWQPITEEALTNSSDDGHGMERIEVTCRSCDAHLGHVFSDGPKPTNLRYCINSASLTLNEET